MKTYILLTMGLALCLMVFSPNVLASEITGTLSNDPSLTNISGNNPFQPNQGVQTPSAKSNQSILIETSVKAAIIGLLVLEVVVLIIIGFMKRRKRPSESAV